MHSLDPNWLLSLLFPFHSQRTSLKTLPYSLPLFSVLTSPWLLSPYQPEFCSHHSSRLFSEATDDLHIVKPVAILAPFVLDLLLDFRFWLPHFLDLLARGFSPPPWPLSFLCWLWLAVLHSLDCHPHIQLHLRPHTVTPFYHMIQHPVPKIPETPF